MKKIITMTLILSMAVSALAGCSGGSKSSDNGTGTTPTASTTQEATVTEAAPSDSYTGSAPITTESGKSLKILAQTSNYTNVDIANAEIVKKVRTNNPKCLIIQVMTDPTCLGVLKSPGTNEIDIFVAEGQSFGISPSFGGPGLGIFTTKQKYLRKIPGRLVGKTKELRGDKEGFILTLQAREQHIRREKASSNICTNQALCALSALIYLLSLGEVGLREVAKQNIQKADHVKKRLADIPGYEILNTKPSYNEFLVKCPDVELLRKECHKLNLLPPLPLSHYYPDKTNIALVCVTELNTKKSIDQFIEAALNASMKGR